MYYRFFFLPVFLIFVFTILFFCFNLAISKELAKFNDWSAYSEGEEKNMACMAVSKPKKAEGDYKKRGGWSHPALPFFLSDYQSGSGVLSDAEIVTNFVAVMLVSDSALPEIIGK